MRNNVASMVLRGKMLPCQSNGSEAEENTMAENTSNNAISLQGLIHIGRLEFDTIHNG